MSEMSTLTTSCQRSLKRPNVQRSALEDLSTVAHIIGAARVMPQVAPIIVSNHVTIPGSGDP